MSLLVESVKVFVVRLTTLPHLPQDLEPALAQTAQRAGMALAFVWLRPVIGRGPRAELAAAIAPGMDRVAQVAVAMPADLGFVDLSALKTHRGRPRHAWQRLGVRV